MNDGIPRALILKLEWQKGEISGADSSTIILKRLPFVSSQIDTENL